ncbi:MAG: hypothetical protein WCH99_08880 [Verrucomicrobiota bacterium]
MSFIASSAAQKARLAGFKANLRVRGRICAITSTNEDDNEQDVTLLIDDAPMMQDSDRPAQAENPVYVVVSSLAGALTDPRSVTAFVEDGKSYRVLEYLETAGDRIAWKWKCEAQRETF